MSQKIKVIKSKIGWAVDGADYTSFSSWLASIEISDPSFFWVGIVRGNDFMKNSYPGPFQDLRHSSYCNYLLVNTSGKIIAWSHHDVSYLDEHLLVNDSRQQDWESKECLKAIRSFIQKNISKDYEINSPIYTDTTIDQKSPLIIQALNKINLEFLEYLSDNPKLLHSLHWREFDRLCEKHII